MSNAVKEEVSSRVAAAQAVLQDQSAGRRVDTGFSVVWLNDLARRSRDDGNPAVVLNDGTQMWYLNGFRHREGDLPAVIRADGTQEWWFDGQPHRENAPAVIHPDGSLEFWTHGVHQPHLDSQPLTEEMQSFGHMGTERHMPGPVKQWTNAVGTPHRGGGLPALEYDDGSRVWIVNGKRHRTDGPAVENVGYGNEWWINGAKVDPF